MLSASNDCSHDRALSLSEYLNNLNLVASLFTPLNLTRSQVSRKLIRCWLGSSFENPENCTVCWINVMRPVFISKLFASIAGPTTLDPNSSSSLRRLSHLPTSHSSILQLGHPSS